VIDAAIGESFQPALGDTVAPRSSNDVYAAYANRNDSERTTPPENVHVQLGWLTLPIGNVGPDDSPAYTAKDELVWSYSWESCPATTLPAKSPPKVCVAWLFLDAATGEDIDQTWQQ
jgi:hypothetical protein